MCEPTALDPTFYRAATEAAVAPPEELACAAHSTSPPGRPWSVRVCDGERPHRCSRCGDPVQRRRASRPRLDTSRLGRIRHVRSLSDIPGRAHNKRFPDVS